ncbi:MAG: pantoate--beta-alanine ligase [Phycisphaerae bacterium]
MKSVSDIEETRRQVLAMRRDGHTVGLVLTMGALHIGHRSLIDAARKRCHRVVVSIFVNPTQFAPGEDCDRYPRTIEADLAVCRESGVDLVFVPSVEQMYAADAATTVHVDRLTEGLCGAHRLGHFDGVTTVVTKLFNIVPAHMAFFGEKDYQQLKTVQRMVLDLNLPIQIVPCPTVREPDGLAVSSRNSYLTPSQRRQALSLYRALRNAVDAFAAGQRDARQLTEQAAGEIRGAGPVEIDYVSVVDAETLEPLEIVDAPARICVAARIGRCRLIDNLPLASSK